MIELTPMKLHSILQAFVIINFNLYLLKKFLFSFICANNNEPINKVVTSRHEST